MTQNRALLALAFGLLAVLGGCASPGPGSAAARDKPQGRLYAGWVRFAGEFALYADASAFADSRTSHCLSGALPPDKQKEAAAKLSGKRVVVRAKVVPWSLPDPKQLTMSNEGSPITNWCGGKEVLLATEMILDEAPAAAPAAKR
jgi:hypothetical protein